MARAWKSLSSVFVSSSFFRLIGVCFLLFSRALSWSSWNFSSSLVAVSPAQKGIPSFVQESRFILFCDKKCMLDGLSTTSLVIAESAGGKRVNLYLRWCRNETSKTNEIGETQPRCIRKFTYHIKGCTTDAVGISLRVRLLEQTDSQLNDRISFWNKFEARITSCRCFILQRPFGGPSWEHNSCHFFIERYPRSFW